MCGLYNKQLRQLTGYLTKLLIRNSDDIGVGVIFSLYLKGKNEGLRKIKNSK